MPGSTLLFAPHENSYDRLVPNAHAPTGIGWAYENRTAAIRIPASACVARRIEHRVAGGDVNPYLSIAAVLGAALNGLEDRAALVEMLSKFDDRVQLAEVVRVCRQCRTLSEAGRVLFQASRTQRTVVNDADRLRKYLARFGLDWERASGAGR